MSEFEARQHAQEKVILLENAAIKADEERRRAADHVSHLLLTT